MLNADINFDRPMGQLRLEDAQRLTASGRAVLLTLAMLPEEAWRSDILDNITALCLDPPRNVPIANNATFATELDDRIDEELLVGRSKRGLDVLGRNAIMTVVKPIEGWLLASSLAVDVAELGFTHNKPIAAIVGRHAQGKSIEVTPARNRIDIYQELLATVRAGRASTKLSSLKKAAGITSATHHVEDLRLLGVIERHVPTQEAQYQIVIGTSDDKVSEVLALRIPGTKPRTIEFRKLVYELCQKPVTISEIAAIIEEKNLTKQLYIPTEVTTRQRRNRAIRKQLAWLEGKGVIESLKAAEDPQNFLPVSASGLLLVAQYLHILQTHSHATEAQIAQNAQRASLTTELANYLAYSDYSLGKFMVEASHEEKDRLIARAMSGHDGPMMVKQIHDALGGTVSVQVIRKHLAASDLFSKVGRKGRQNVYVSI